MKKCSVPILITLILGFLNPFGLGIDIVRLSAQVGPNPPPPPVLNPPRILQQTGNNILPPGSDITLEILAEGEGRLDYQWFFNGSPIRNEKGTSYTIRQADSSDVGTYFAIVFNEAGLDRSRNMNLNLKREGSIGIGFPWVSRFEPLQAGFHRPNDVTTDRAGNVYVVGEVPSNRGDADFVIIKYSKDGQEEWSRLLNPSEGQDDRAQAVEIQPNGNIVVLGTANTRGGGNGNLANGFPQIVAASLSPEGVREWVTPVSMESIRGAEAVSLALTSEGHVLLTGTGLGTQNQNIVTARLNANGVQQWAKSFDGGGMDSASSIATDRSGNALVVGTSFSQDQGDDIIAILYNLRGTEIWNYRKSSDERHNDIGTNALFDSRDRPIIVGAIKNEQTGLDFFVSRLSPGGNEQFATTETSRGNVDDIPVGAVLDGSNSVLVAGNSRGGIQGSEAMILKINAQGSVAWARIQQASDRPGDQVNDAAATSDGGIVVAGGKANPPFGVDMINAKFDSSGVNIWDARFSLIPEGSVFDIATAIDIDPRGDVILVGVSNGQAGGEAQVGSNTQLITIKQQITPPTQNTLPAVRIDQPQPGTQYEFEQEIDIIVTAIDQEGPIELIEILVGDRIIGRSTTSPFRATWIVDTVNPVLITARVTDNDGGVVTAGTPIEVIVTDIRPEIVSFPSSQSVVPGESLALAAEVTGRAPLNYKWFQNGQRIKDARGPTLVIENFGSKNAGRYELVVENPAGRAISPAITIELDIPTVIAGDNFADRLSLPGESGQVKVSTLGATRETGEPRHANKRSVRSVWFSYVAGAEGLIEISTIGADFDTILAVYTGTELSNLAEVANDEDRGGLLTSSLRFKAEPDQEYIISVVGFNQHEGTAVLTWNFDRTRIVNVPRFTIQPAETVARLGSQINLTANIQGPRPPGVALQWVFNDVEIVGETGPQLRIENIGPNQVGEYWVKATLGNLEATSDRASLAIAARRAINAVVVTEIKRENKFADLFFNFAGANAQALQRQRRRPIRLAASLATGFSGAQIFNTFGAVKELGEPDHCDIPGGASQWFAYQAPIDGPVGMTTDGSDFDTVIAIYTAEDSDFSNLTEVACDNDSGLDGLDSSVTFDAVANTIYYVAIDGVEAETGVVELTYSSLDLPLELSLTSTAGSSIGGVDEVTGFTYTVTAIPNVDFVIETSEDLITWRTVTTAQAENGTFEFQDSDFGLATFERYFRVFYP